MADNDYMSELARADLAAKVRAQLLTLQTERFELILQRNFAGTDTQEENEQIRNLEQRIDAVEDEYADLLAEPVGPFEAPAHGQPILTLARSLQPEKDIRTEVGRDDG